MSLAGLISTSNTWPNYSANNVKAAASKKPQELGKDQFLSILVAQLKNQDPMSPMDNSQFIAQMAQFSSVEQLINIGEKLDGLKGSNDTSLGGASELIGKQITWLNESTNSAGETTSTYETGIVGSIVSKGGVLYAQVGEDAVPLSLVARVEAGSTKPAASDTPVASETPAASPVTTVQDTPATQTTPTTVTTEPADTTTTAPASETPAAQTPADTASQNDEVPAAVDTPAASAEETTTDNSTTNETAPANASEETEA